MVVEHSRFNKEHRNSCTPCTEAYEDFVEQSHIDEQEEI